MSKPIKRLFPTTPRMSATVYRGDTESYALAGDGKIVSAKVPLLHDGSPITHGLFEVCWYWWLMSTGLSVNVPALVIAAAVISSIATKSFRIEFLRIRTEDDKAARTDWVRRTSGVP